MKRFMHKKQILCLIFVLAAAISLAACSRNRPPEESTPPVVGSTPPVVGSTPESSWEESPQEESQEPQIPDERQYLSVTGTITQVEPFYDTNNTPVEGSYYVFLTDADGGEHTFAITPDTYLANDNEMQEGATIIGFYDANAPMILIYPPRYNVEAVAVDLDTEIKLDRFNEDLISSDNELKLNIAETTEIILADGVPFDGDLTGRKLLVFYGPTTRSIPAQTTPEKIVVLFETAVPPLYKFPEEEPSTLESIPESPERK